MNRINVTRFGIIGTLCVLACCTPIPKYAPPEMEIPTEWSTSTSEEMKGEGNSALVWWEEFNDPILNSLIERAAESNLDLFIAATRVLEARAERTGKGGDLLPHIDLSLNADHVYYSKDALVNGLLGLARPSCSKHVKRNVNFFEIGFDADWEIDFFGLKAHELEALKAKGEAAEEMLGSVWVSLAAEIALNYIELRGYQQTQLILEKQIEMQQESLYLNSDLEKGGVVSEITVNQMKARLHELEGSLPKLQLSISMAVNRLAILLGQAPGTLCEELSEVAALPSLPQPQPIGVPSDLLRRRPDIRRAERLLAAASEQVASAIAALYPRFSLQGFIGEISTHVGSIFNPASFTWAAGPQLLMPIFNSRLILEGIDYNKILLQRAVYEYQKTVLEALEEAENAIATYQSRLKQQSSLVNVLSARQQAYELSQILHERGISDDLTVLNEMVAVANADNACLEGEIMLLKSYITLYKALGGAWQPIIADPTSCECE